MFAHHVGKKEVTADSDTHGSYARSVDRQCRRYQSFHAVYRRLNVSSSLFTSLFSTQTRVHARANVPQVTFAMQNTSVRRDHNYARTRRVF